METIKPDEETSSPYSPLQRVKLFLSNHKGKIGFGVLIVYVFLLGLGTIGELWDIEWILDLPIFRPPGKY